MHLAQTEFGEGLKQHLETLFQILQVNLLALFDEGEDNIDLPPFSNLLADAVIERGHTGVEDMGGAYGFASRRQFVDDTHVQVAVERHGQCTGDRRGCHHQYMGRVGALAP